MRVVVQITDNCYVVVVAFAFLPERITENCTCTQNNSKFKRVSIFTYTLAPGAVFLAPSCTLYVPGAVLTDATGTLLTAD